MMGASLQQQLPTTFHPHAHVHPPAHPAPALSTPTPEHSTAPPPAAAELDAFLLLRGRCRYVVGEGDISDISKLQPVSLEAQATVLAHCEPRSAFQRVARHISNVSWLPQTLPSEEAIADAQMLCGAEQAITAAEGAPA